MIDKATLQACKDSSIVLEMKIKNLEFAVSQSELMISESRGIKLFKKKGCKFHSRSGNPLHDQAKQKIIKV